MALEEILSQVDCFLQLFLDNAGTTLALVGLLRGPVFSEPGQAALYEEYCTGSGNTMASPPWPAGTPCYAAAPAEIASIVFGRIVAGMIPTMILGNIFYAWQAQRLASKEKRTNVTALPYGISATSFITLFSVLLPAGFLLAASDRAALDEFIATSGPGAIMTSPPRTPAQIAYGAWEVGCISNLAIGAVSVLLGLAGPTIIRVTPSVALYVVLAGLGFTFLGLTYFISAATNPSYSFLPLAVMVLLFFGGVDLGMMPASVVVMLSGMIPAWIWGEAWQGGGSFEAVTGAIQTLGFYPPTLLPLESLEKTGLTLATYSSVIFPMAFTLATTTMLNVYSAKEVGDEFPMRETITVDGVATIVAGLCGCPLQTTVYIGHPAYKKRGGRYLFSAMNAVVFVLLAVTGLFDLFTALIPEGAYGPIILFVGLAVNKDAASITPERHLPAYIIGLFPVICDWMTGQGSGFGPGIQSLREGSLLTCLLWSALFVNIIDRNFLESACWGLACTLAACVGMIHQPAITMPFTEAWWATQASVFTFGYAQVAVLFCALHLYRKHGGENAKALLPPPETLEQLAPEQVYRKTSLLLDSTSALGLPAVNKESELLPVES